MKKFGKCWGMMIYNLLQKNKKELCLLKLKGLCYYDDRT